MPGSTVYYTNRWPCVLRIKSGKTAETAYLCSLYVNPALYLFIFPRATIGVV